MRVIIEADGGSRGNPGIAGSGSVIYNAEHTTELKAISYVVGEATNNVAEYHGLLNGLRAAAALGATEVAVRMDSKLVIEQMSGRWKIKHPDMKELALECKKVADSFNEVTFDWIPRSENDRADELANIAMDAAAEGAASGAIIGSESSDAYSASNTTSSGATTGALSGKQAAGIPETTDRSTGGAKVVSPSSWNGATTKPTRFLLLRHGQTEMSVNKLYSGRSNPPLTKQGMWQAQRAAQRIAERGGLAAIVASPLTRCQQTAQAVADKLGMTVTTCDDLIEVDFGDWEGLSFAQAHQAAPQLHTQWLADSSIKPPGGELSLIHI